MKFTNRIFRDSNKIKFGYLVLTLLIIFQFPISSQNLQKIISKNIKSNVLNSPNKIIPNSYKLDSFSRILLTKKQSINKQNFAKNFNLSAKLDNNNKIKADFFIQLENESDIIKIVELGIKIRIQISNIVIINTDLEKLNYLLKLPEIRKIEISHNNSSKLDSSRKSIRADLVHQGLELPKEYKGEDVILGVIDSGIDFTHSDFIDENGSRILYLLEYTQDGGETEWTKNNLDNNPGNVTQVDGNGSRGHGTHVAGIAAGNGSFNPAMIGIAPKSDIIFVKVYREPESYGFFSDVDVVAGCQYIFNKAKELGKPAVINLSLGSQFGPHDGTSLYEQSLAELTGPGNILVVAAGNDGNKFIHAGGTSLPNTLNETLVVADSSNQYAGITMWYDYESLNGISVFAYDKQFNFIGQTPINQAISETPVIFNNDTLGFVTIDKSNTPDPNNGDGNISILIENLRSPNINISETIWSIGSYGKSEGRIDLWAFTGCSFYSELVGFQDETEMPGNNEFSLGPPATANKVISVGSYTTKTGWTDNENNVWLAPEFTINDIAQSSSKGPTRDGRITPNISAPGQLIFSAFSSHLIEGIGYNKRDILQGGGYQVNVGTSMAAPHISGIVALMLQIKNDLIYDEIVQYFSETSRTNQYTGSVPNNNVGWGYIDAYNVIKTMSNLVIDVELSDKSIPQSFQLYQNYPNPFNPVTTINYSIPLKIKSNKSNGFTSSGNEGEKVTLKVYNILGRELRTLVNEIQSSGIYQVGFDASILASGIYYYQLRSGGFIQSKKMLLLK